MLARDPSAKTVKTAKILYGGDAPAGFDSFDSFDKGVLSAGNRYGSARQKPVRADFTGALHVVALTDWGVQCAPRRKIAGATTKRFISAA
jgi:hypothetical protein